MNHIYRLVWNDLTRAWVAVAENAKGRGKRSSATVGAIAATLALIGPPAWALDASALPTGGKVVAGTASISQAGNVMNITQSTQRAALDWQSFNIGASATVNFIQPSSSAVALNRILGNEASQIYGRLNANGHVFFSNPNGMLFARGAEVNVGGLLATTLAIGNEDFMAGNYRFTSSGNSAGTGSIRNEGLINAVNSAALIGNTVENAGRIVATTVTLAAGNTVAVDLTADGLIRARVEEPALRARIENSGSIEAVQAVTMTAGQAKDMLDRVVNNSGVIRAAGLIEKNGEILLEASTVENTGTVTAHGGTIKLMGDMAGGTVKVGGTLDASAPTTGNGGFIETSAAHVDIAVGTRVTTAAALGLAGTWLIDPVDFTIAASGGNITGATLSSNLGSGSITIYSTNGTVGTAGDVNVNDVVAWSANKLTLNAQNNININANLNGSGSASLAFEYGQQAVAAGNTSTYNINAPVNLPAGNNFSTKLGSDGAVKAYTVITSLGAAGSTTAADLQGIKGGPTLNYVLGSNIDATATSTWNSGAGFAPIGPNNSTPFRGTFDGLGHTISNLAINRPTENYVGLFGYAENATIRNVGLVGGSVSGGGYHTGGLVGYLVNTTISNSYNTGTVTGSYSYIGGLVGSTYGAATKITSSYATGSVSKSGGNSYDAHVGGLVGRNRGTAISNSYATGDVTTGSEVGNYYLGGLVGYNDNNNLVATISSSYATGSVTGSGTSGRFGGLVGYNLNGTVSNSYATGSVTGTASLGGLVGSNYSGSVSNSYWNTTTSGRATSAGGTGLTTAQMQNAANFTGFTFTTTPGAAGWVMVNGDGSLNGSTTGGTTPMLASEYSATINNAHQLQLMRMNLAGNYTLGSNIDAAKTATSTDVWSSEGFVPVGNAATNFTGTFDGSNHTISNLTINRPTTDSVGLFGRAGAGATIRNAGLVSGSVSGQFYVGGLVGNVVSNVTISNAYFSGNVSGDSTIGGLIGNATSANVSSSYATGSVSGLGGHIGGLFGWGLWATVTNSYATNSVSGGTSSAIGGLVGGFSNGSSTISNSYATGSVSGGNQSIGGLVGNAGSYNMISNSYATGSVSSTGIYVGGLVGTFYDSGTISNSYATGGVIGSGAYVGGLVGYLGTSAINSSYWNSDVKATGIGNGTVAGATGRTTTQMQQMDSFTGWSITRAGGAGATWRIYEGHTAPLLASFLTPLTLTDAPDATVAYNGSAQNGATTATAGVLGAAATGINVGFYNGYYSTQQGYDLVGGNLTINPANITINLTGTRAYDGTNIVNASIFTLGGLVGSETLTLTGAGTVADKNVGANKPVTLGALALGDGTGLASNYTFTGGTHVATITPASLTVTAGNASRIYGEINPGFTGGITGFVNGETGSVLTAQPTYGTAATQSSNVGSYSIVSAGGTAQNYSFTYVNGSLGITARPLSVTANSQTKTYGDADPALSYAIGATAAGSGLVNGDTLSGSLTRLAGETVAGGPYAISQGSLAATSNYTVSYTGNNLTITPATLIYEATPATRYAGEANPTFTGSVSGFKLSDTLASIASGTAVFDSIAILSSPEGSYPVDGSGITLTTSNYLLAQAAGNATALTVTAPPPAATTTTALAATETVAAIIQTVMAPVVSIPPSAPTLIAAPAPTETAPEKNEPAPAATPAVPIVTVANTTVQKPADQVVQADKPRGQMLVCR